MKENKDIEKGEGPPNGANGANGNGHPTNAEKLNGVGRESLTTLDAQGVGSVHSNGNGHAVNGSAGGGYAAVATVPSSTAVDNNDQDQISADLPPEENSLVNS